MARTFARALSVAVVLWLIAIANIVGDVQRDPEAVFNVESKIYHRASCQWARRCTKNCIVIKLSEARRRGRACKVCGGPTTDLAQLEIAPLESVRFNERAGLP